MGDRPQKARGNREFTMHRNVVADAYLHLFDGDEFRVWYFGRRKTAGWQKESDDLSVSQISKATGLSRASIFRHLASLERKGFASRKANPGQPTTWEFYEHPTRLKAETGTAESTRLRRETGGVSRERRDPSQERDTQKKLSKRNSPKERNANAGSDSLARNEDVSPRDGFSLDGGQDLAPLRSCLRAYFGESPSERTVREVLAAGNGASQTDVIALLNRKLAEYPREHPHGPDMWKWFIATVANHFGDARGQSGYWTQGGLDRVLELASAFDPASEKAS